ncbi:MAG TPA: glycoside hydrolase family 15 protein [Pyrinomonadaceae bacterium]|jgi:glucoamylase
MSTNKRKLKNRRIKKSFVFILPFYFLLFTCLSAAQTLAPGAPGKDAQWASAGKQGVGTSVSLESKIWFTLQGGALTEVYYPDVTVANVHLLQFVVVNPKTKRVETERDDAVHKVEATRPDSLTFRQINTAKSGEWKITKTYVTDPERASVLIDVRFEPKNKDLNLYVYYDPSLGNSGMGDSATLKFGLTATESFEKGGKSSFLHIENPALGAGDVIIKEWTVGFYQVSDGFEQLRTHGKIVTQYVDAKGGNVAMMGKIEKPERFTAILSFADSHVKAKQTASATKDKGFAKCLAEYEKGWSDYVKTVRRVEPKYQAQFNMAAMQLKAHEDKTHRGANIASLSVPWGGGENANENTVAGYHLVWSRDLYQVATAYMALGDKEAAIRALDFLFRVQQKPDGSFPQNSFLDGKPFWGSLQLDEVAYPLILAYQLGRNDRATWESHVKKAADFIVRNGPKTPQERWEEEAGFSPSTIAAEIAGLVCASEIARKNGDEASATIYLATADDWARKIEMWTATTTGKYGDGNYYLRITQNGKPDAGGKIELNNGAGFFDEREIVDAGFLELVRLGIKPAGDPLIAKSVKVIDQIIKVNTPNGEGFYRYNHDGYGEMDDGRRWNWDGKYTGKGGLWALLSGERGQYEIAVCGMRNADLKANEQCLSEAKSRLDAMLAFSNEGLMIPEQVWDSPKVPNADSQFSPNLKFGEGTGSATPLAWSMAQFIRLAVNLQAGKNLETPDVVFERYKNGIPGQASNFGGMDIEAVVPVKAGEKFSFSRSTVPNAKVVLSFKGVTRMLPVNEKGEFPIEIIAPEKEEIGLLVVQTPDGATAFERVRVISSDKIKPQEFSPETIEKIKNAKQSPIIENGKAILFYRGAAKQINVAGDMTNWNSAQIFMQPIAENLHAIQIDVPSDTRAEYKLVVDGKWIQDPLNPNKLDNSSPESNSFFAMPEYKPAILDTGGNDVVEKIDFKSQALNNVYPVQTYVPGECVRNSCPALYLQDGGDYIKLGGAVQIQQNLVKAGKVKPFIMVFISPKERTKEYWASDDYARFLATEIVPAIDAKYNTIKNRDGRAIIGASLGGVTSLWVGLKYPDKFARIGGQSSSFWIDNERVVKELARLDPAKTKFTFYLDDGTFEGSEDTRRVNVMLRGKGYPVAYVEGATAHNWTSWRDRLADAFIALMN